MAAQGCRREPTLIGTVRVRSLAARAAPSASARTIARFPRINAQGARQVFVLPDTKEAREGRAWYRALLPVRPNGTTGFIRADYVRISETDYRLQVSRRKLIVTLWKGCRVVRTYPIGLGTESTPTPVGSFYLISLLNPPDPDSVYGTYAYGLSAYSDAITDWKGGGIIGLHGTNDPSSIGKRMSHGCIRMRNGDIGKLVKILPLGTPIDIA
jgi:hypothetical protein